MKVLVLSNLYPPDVLGGYEVACSQAVDGLRGRGHDVTVLTSRPRSYIADPPHVLRRLHLSDEFGLHGLGDDPLIFRTREAESRFLNSYNVHMLLDVLDEVGPGVVYLHNLVGLGGLGLLQALEQRGMPWVWHLGDCSPRDLCSTSDGVVDGLARRFAGAFRGHFLVVSRRTLEECAVVGLRPGRDVTLLPYWIHGPRVPPRPRYYAGGPLRVVAAGRVDEQKGADRLIDAAARLAAAGIDDVSIDLYGRIGSPALPARVNALGLGRQVRLLGPIAHEELLRRLADYDIFAFPTQEREPFGLGPIEAMARGCVPLIAARCGVAEWLVHGVHGLKAERTAKGFAAALAAIRRGEVELDSLARRAHRAAWDDFHLDAMLPCIEHRLLLAARERRPPRSDRAEVYRLARMGELIARSFIEDAITP